MINIIKGVFFPQSCVVCGEAVKLKSSIVCEKCKDKVSFLRGKPCLKCGIVVEDENEQYCEECLANERFFDRGFVLYTYDEPVKKAIYDLKYNGVCEYGRIFGEVAVKHFGPELKRYGRITVVPVPLHTKKEKERGYNQAYEIAFALAENLPCKLDEKMLVRTENTKPLKEIGDTQRRLSLRGAFKCAKERVAETVCIVDDIYTTGATIDECAFTLKRAGVKRVLFLTVSNGGGI